LSTLASLVSESLVRPLAFVLNDSGSFGRSEKHSLIRLVSAGAKLFWMEQLSFAQLCRRTRFN
jgi:hypothetical protein